MVDDPDAVHASAKENSARMVIDIKDRTMVERGFTCTDLEGHLCSFGSYDPWGHPPQGE